MKEVLLYFVLCVCMCVCLCCVGVKEVCYFALGECFVSVLHSVVLCKSSSVLRVLDCVVGGY